jgi:hypothetical protein
MIIPTAGKPRGFAAPNRQANVHRFIVRGQRHAAIATSQCRTTDTRTIRSRDRTPRSGRICARFNKASLTSHRTAPRSFVVLSRPCPFPFIMLCHSISTLALLAAVPMVLTGTVYNLVDDITGNNFLSAFEHQDFPDPTHGRVCVNPMCYSRSFAYRSTNRQYVDQPTATQNNLTFVSQNTIIMRADSTKTLDPSGPGRMSIRVQSLKQYTTHVAVFDVRHIPEGCSTWPS